MKQKIPIKLFLNIIGNRPAFVKKVVDPSERLLISIVKRNTRVLMFLSKEQKSAAVCNAALNEELRGRSNYSNPDESMIPGEMYHQLDPKMVQEELIIHPSTINFIPNPTHEMWKAAGSSVDVDWDKIPKELGLEIKAAGGLELLIQSGLKTWPKLR